MSYSSVKNHTEKFDATLVAVSKTKPLSDILNLYESGQRHFGENRVQELRQKYEDLPKDILWHQIGTLQTNKVKYIAPFVHLIHSVDSLKLAKTIIKEAQKVDRCIDVLVQIKVAQEETKHGIDQKESLTIVEELVKLNSPFIRLRGIMAMASFSNDQELVKAEFLLAKEIFDSLNDQYFADKDHWDILSMGMSGDYLLAMECGSTMVRVGSLIFGSRNYD